MSKHYTKDVRQLAYLVDAIQQDYAEQMAKLTGVSRDDIMTRINNEANLAEIVGEPDALLIDEHLSSEAALGNSSTPTGAP